MSLCVYNSIFKIITLLLFVFLFSGGATNTIYWYRPVSGFRAVKFCTIGDNLFFLLTMNLCLLQAVKFSCTLYSNYCILLVKLYL